MTMCLGIPGRMVELVEGYCGQIALVEVEGKARTINVGMLERPPDPGQWVLIHLGFAVETIDQAGAKRAMSGLELMGRARDEDGGTGESRVNQDRTT
jgi:hydrogenase assembly chaperone HypC/HupF